MSGLIFALSAHAQLAELVAREDLPGVRLEAAVQELLDVLETNPGDRRVRTVRYIRPAVWSARVPTPVSEGQWVILWDYADRDTVQVLYVGPDTFA